MPKKLLSPEAVRDFLATRFKSQHQNWLAGEGSWPLPILLGVPTQNEVADDPVGVRAWVQSWMTWKGAGELQWQVRQFPRLGTHRLPISLVLTGPACVAAWVGQDRRWTVAFERYARMAQRWPNLAAGQVLSSKFNVLADYSAEDFERLFSLLAWIEANPASGLYLRQLPVEGLDTKWIEQRTVLVAALLRIIRGVAMEGGDFYDLCGLRRQAHRFRVHVLCPELRKAVGGLRDIEAPVEELAMLPIVPASAIIVENLETGLALPDISGAVAVMKLGNAVTALASLPWLTTAKAIYWGDIDTHGFAILDRARSVLPCLWSVMMDEATLLAHRPMWGREATQCADLELPRLLEHERRVYLALRAQTHGRNVRLEQERLPWGLVLESLREAIA